MHYSYTACKYGMYQLSFREYNFCDSETVLQTFTLDKNQIGKKLYFIIKNVHVLNQLTTKKSVLKCQNEEN